ncbi:MAG: cobyric acid synthase [Acidobacteriota bacterium]
MSHSTSRRQEKPGAALMVVGTHSDAGKSILVTALCRIFAQQGVRVAPFKSQNMSLNAGVTPEGHEIGRSTCAQAEAAGVAPHVDMNPVLIKPEAECRSQVVLEGRPWGRIEAGNWHELKALFWQHITAAFDRLRARYELVIMEGAGSPAEINLMANDNANLRVAQHADAPAILVGDIDRGGVFASLLGTVSLLEPAQRELVKGFVINKMRGDPRLLGDGPERLRERAFGIPTLGVIPYLPDLGIAEEDSVALARPARQDDSDAEIDLAVVQLTHVANFDDFDPLAREPGVRLRYVASVEELGTPSAVLLPGTKTTLADLAWLRDTGLAEAVVTLARRGVPVVGICGGFQMLGSELSDPEGSEAAPGAIDQGLGLLPVNTRFASDKRTVQVEATWRAPAPAGLAGISVRGYEIHMGQSETLGLEPAFRLAGSNQPDGACSADGRIWGTYLHGLFDNDAFRHAWLRTLGWTHEGRCFDREPAYDRLAAHVRDHLDLAALETIIWGDRSR